MNPQCTQASSGGKLPSPAPMKGPSSGIGPRKSRPVPRATSHPPVSSRTSLHSTWRKAEHLLGALQEVQGSSELLSGPQCAHRCSRPKTHWTVTSFPTGMRLLLSVSRCHLEVLDKLPMGLRTSRIPAHSATSPGCPENLPSVPSLKLGQSRLYAMGEPGT